MAAQNSMIYNNMLIQIQDNYKHYGNWLGPTLIIHWLILQRCDDTKLILPMLVHDTMSEVSMFHSLIVRGKNEFWNCAVGSDQVYSKAALGE